MIRGYQIAMQADPTLADARGGDHPVRPPHRAARRRRGGLQGDGPPQEGEETAEPLGALGDFLSEEKKDPLAAIERYLESLI